VFRLYHTSHTLPSPHSAAVTVTEPVYLFSSLVTHRRQEKQVYNGGFQLGEDGHIRDVEEDPQGTRLPRGSHIPS